ncbi:MAG: cyclic lactone autoinducer peptide [Lachnospiraceae bacterium]|jgi:cyclic lactone autoinducer peptide|nr:cyclic lactone autoinducer peptide [Lachnospiraceae bacterium]
MRRKFNKALARIGESVARTQNGIVFCNWIFHEPVMPESLRNAKAEKEVWRR